MQVAGMQQEGHHTAYQHALMTANLSLRARTLTSLIVQTGLIFPGSKPPCEFVGTAIFKP